MLIHPSWQHGARPRGYVVFCGFEADLDWAARGLSKVIILKALGRLGGDVAVGGIQEV